MSVNISNYTKGWLLAIRPKTLPAAAAPVLVGTSMAYYDGGFHFLTALACLSCAILLQIGSNLANDVFDYEKGADRWERLGPTRVTQSGILSSREVKIGMLFVFGLSMLLGVYLIIVGGWPILFLGIAAIISAIAYTGGPFPLGYHGLGDLFVFIFFGLAAVGGTYYVQLRTITFQIWLLGAAIGLLTVAILVVNNLRDIESDRMANKQTLAVRFGKRFVRIEYIFCILGAYGIPLILWGMGKLPFLSLAIFITFPISIQLIRSIFNDTGRALNMTLARTGRLELFYALCFSFGIITQALIE